MNKTRVAYVPDLKVPAALAPVGETNVLMFNLELLFNGRSHDEVELMVNALLAECDVEPAATGRDELAERRAERSAVSPVQHHTLAL